MRTLTYTFKISAMYVLLAVIATFTALVVAFMYLASFTTRMLIAVGMTYNRDHLRLLVLPRKLVAEMRADIAQM